MIEHFFYMKKISNFGKGVLNRLVTWKSDGMLIKYILLTVDKMDSIVPILIKIWFFDFCFHFYLKISSALSWFSGNRIFVNKYWAIPSLILSVYKGDDDSVFPMRDHVRSMVLLDDPHRFP